jgi:hypothetical protein
MTRTRIALAVCAAVALSAAPVVTSSAAGLKFHAKLSGAQEVPSKGDPDGGATVTLSANGDKGLCYDIRPTKLETPQMAHIHSGRKGKPGAILLDLFTKAKAPKNGRITGCAKITAKQLEQITAKPGSFYVNLHTKKYPSGAVRGQISSTTNP